MVISLYYSISFFVVVVKLEFPELFYELNKLNIPSNIFQQDTVMF